MDMVKASDMTCVIEEGTTTMTQAMSYMSGTTVKIVGVPVTSAATLMDGNMDYHCTSSDASSLAAMKAEMPDGMKDEWVILPELLSKEPLGPVTREGDDQFTDLV
eukprot:scaffold647974_cov41-Prasinocladus_malaysianus.AAC.1